MKPFSRSSAFAGFIIFCLLHTAGTTFAVTYRLYVEGTGGDDAANDGRSWGSAYKTFGKALREMDANGSIGEVWLAAGTYGDDGNYSINASESVYSIKKPIKIYGGFVGTETDARERDFARNKTGSEFHKQYAGHSEPATATILQGPQDGKKKRVLRINGNVTLDGVTVRDGYSPGEDGGGILVESGQVTLNRIKFINNTSAEIGGGLYVVSGTVNLSWCIFDDNLAKGDGGGGAGAAEFGATIKIVNSKFLNNKTHGANGGACYFLGLGENGAWSFYGCRFENNTSDTATMASSMVLGKGGYFRFCTFLDTKPANNNIITTLGTLFYESCLYNVSGGSYNSIEDTSKNPLNLFDSDGVLVTSVSGDVDTNHGMDLDGDGIIDTEWLYDLDGYLRDKTFGATSPARDPVETFTITFTPHASDPLLEGNFTISNKASPVTAEGMGIKRDKLPTTLKITSNPSHWRFKHWDWNTTFNDPASNPGGLPSSGDLTYTVAGSDADFLAEFEPIPYTISIATDPSPTATFPHTSLVWGRYTTDGGGYEDDTVNRPNDLGTVLIREANGSEVNSSTGNYFETAPVILEANASLGYQLLGWVIRQGETEAEQAAADLPGLIKSGSAKTDSNSTHGGAMDGSTYYTANPLTIIFDSNKSIIPIFEEKNFDFLVQPPRYSPSDLNVTASANEDVDPDYSEEGPGLGKKKSIIYTVPTGWELDMNTTLIGGESWLYWKNLYPTDFNHTLDMVPFLPIASTSASTTHRLTFRLKREMRTTDAGVVAEPVFKPVSFRVTAIPGEFLLVPSNSIKGVDIEIYPGGNGMELGVDSFVEGSDVVLSLQFHEAGDANATIINPGKVDVNWRWSMEDGDNSPIEGEVPKNSRMSILGLKGDVVAYYDLSIKSFYFKHKIYFREPTADDPDPPYVIEKSLHLSGDKVFVPQFPVTDGYSIKHLDGEPREEGSKGIYEVNATIDVKNDENYPENAALDYFTLEDSNLTIVSIYEPKTYDLNVTTVFEEGGIQKTNLPAGGVVWLLPDSPSRQYRFGDKIQLDAVPEGGHDFLRWLPDGDTNATRYVNISGDHNYTAVFGLKPKSIALSFSGSGEFYVDDTQYGSGAIFSRPYDRPFSVRAIPAKGYRFEGDLKVLDALSPLELHSYASSLNETTKMEQVDANFTVLQDLRVVATFVPDSGDYDGDGLSNYDESLYGTRHDLNDTDGDKIPDYWEVIDWNRLREDNATYDDAFWEEAQNVRYLFRDLNQSVRYDPAARPSLSLDPLDLNDSATDLDFDNVSNYAEFLSRTNPIDPETIEDGDVDQPTVAFLEDLGAEELAASKINTVKFLFKLDSNMSDGEGNSTFPTPAVLGEVNQSLDENQTVKYSVLEEFNSRIIKLKTITPGFLFRYWHVATPEGFQPKDYNSTALEYQPIDGVSFIELHFVRDDNDTDADGLTNYEELYVHKTNADNNDTDGDGILDGFEVEKGLDANSTSERLVLDLVPLHHQLLGITFPDATSPSNGSNAPDADLNATVGSPSDGNYTKGVEDGRSEVIGLWADYNSSHADYQDGLIIGKTAGKNEVLTLWSEHNSSERIDLYRFISADKGVLLPSVTVGDKGWFYTPAHGWSWLSPDIPGYLYNAEVSNWIWLNPYIDPSVTTPFGQFLEYIQGTADYGDYPTTSSDESAPASSNASGQDSTGFGDL